MPTYRVTVNGVPFTVDGDGTQEDAAAYLRTAVAADPTLVDRRTKQLGLTEDDILAIAQQNGERMNDGQPFMDELGGAEKFFVGAGRSASELITGAKQLFSDQETSDELARMDSRDKALFDKLDNQGIGMEDLGQLMPDVAAFIGSGGSSAGWQLASLGARGAALGAARPVGVGEGGEERAEASLTSGLLSMAGPAIAKGVGSMFRSGTKATKAVGGAILNRVQAGGGDVGKGIANVVDEATTAIANNRNKALQDVGRVALTRAAEVVQKMNDRGKNSVVSGMVNKALANSVTRNGNVNVLDPAAFNRELIAVGNGALKKELGPALGKSVKMLRETFDELARVGDLDEKTSKAVLQNLMDNPQAGAVAKALTATAKPEVKHALRAKLIDMSLATAGAQVEPQQAVGAAAAAGTLAGM